MSNKASVDRLEEMCRETLIAWVRQLQEQVAHLQEQLSLLRALSAQLLEANRTLSDQNEQLARELEQLRLSGQAVVVKPSRRPAQTPKPPRKKRTQSFVRRRETPTREVVHALDRCPTCDEPLAGGWEKRRRQVIEIPATPVEIIDHVVVERRCPRCHQDVAPTLTQKELGVVGQHRVGVRLMSWVGLLHIAGRVPLATVQRILQVVYGLHLSRGELSEILHTIARVGKEERAGLLKALRGAPVVHGDETSWRENGVNGYIWSFSTPLALPNPIRYFEYRKSRAGQVAVDVLGDTYEGTLVSDFYGGYNALLGPHQRCWVHLLRDMHALKEKYPDDPSVQEWSQQIYEIYVSAKQWQPQATQRAWEEKERLSARRAFEAALMAVARPYLERSGAPQRVLSQRIARFLPELFAFVEDPRVPSDNNAAERSVRPSVIARKISGGTRSSQGSETQMTLMTLFGTWALRGLDLLETCCRLLLAPPVPQSVPP